MRKTISVTEAARNFAECVNRAHYQNVTFVLLKNGSPVAHITPPGPKVCTGSDLAAALAEVELPSEEARNWNSDLRNARKNLKPLPDKWR
jgi:antitoxin (DNA-binding transcriptional repressor) of toxin-antitoxin stability system